MKEPVRKTKYPYLWGVAIGAIGLVYAYFSSVGNKTPEPGVNLEYDIQPYLDIDKVETRFAETRQIVPDIKGVKALATDGAGNLYAGGENAIAVYDPAGKESSRIAIEGTPSCLAFAPDGRLLVGVEDKVVVLGADRAPIATWSNFTERSLITAIAANEEEVYLADAASRCVLRVDYAGKVLNRIGEMDEKRDIPGLEVPSPYFDLAFDKDGELWVVNPGKLGLERYRSNGDIVTSWYNASVTNLEGFSGCCNPVQIAFNSEGRLVTAEKGPVRVKIYEVTSGTFEELVVGSSAFHVPQSVGDIAVDTADRIFVLDPKKKNIRVFEATKTKLAARAAGE
jgi:hypothetical protein